MSTKTIITSFENYLRENGRSPSTIVAYKTDIRQFLEYSNIELADLNKKSVDNFFTYLEENYISPKTISRKLNSIRTFSNFLYRRRKIETDF